MNRVIELTRVAIEALDSFNDPEPITFSGSQFKELRTLKGLTRRQLLIPIARYKPTTTKTIFTWENGQAALPNYAIMALLETSKKKE